MKNIPTYLFAVISLVVSPALAQTPHQTENAIRKAPIQISYLKTSSIIFPAVIKSVDRGSKDILVQKVRNTENVLQLKAARENFPETNLTVITADGTMYEFNVNFAVEPSILSLGVTDNDTKPLIIFRPEITESELADNARWAYDDKRRVRFISDRHHKIVLILQGVYIRNNVMFFSVSVTNRSNINYDIESLKFYVRDKSQVKRTASQELEIKPLFVHGNNRLVSGGESNKVVFALEKFTIPDAKRFHLEMFEQGGGRHLRLILRNKTIVNARNILTSPLSQPNS